MLGNNSFTFCEAQMKEMVEHYLKTKLLHAQENSVVVDSIKHEVRGGSNTFIVKLRRQEKEPKEA